MEAALWLPVERGCLLALPHLKSSLERRLSSVPLRDPVCVLSDDLVEKMPCAWNSSRVCECQPGMFCAVSVVNSCARCFFHSVCPAGMIVKFPGQCPHPRPRTEICAVAAAPSAHPSALLTSDLLLPEACWTDHVSFGDGPGMYPAPSPSAALPHLVFQVQRDPAVPWHRPGWRRSWFGLRLKAAVI